MIGNATTTIGRGGRRLLLSLTAVTCLAVFIPVPLGCLGRTTEWACEIFCETSIQQCGGDEVFTSQSSCERGCNKVYEDEDNACQAAFIYFTDCWWNADSCRARECDDERDELSAECP